MDADIFVSGKKKLGIQKNPDTCGRGLRTHPMSHWKFHPHANYETENVISKWIVVLKRLVLRKLLGRVTGLNNTQICPIWANSSLFDALLTLGNI